MKQAASGTATATDDGGNVLKVRNLIIAKVVPVGRAHALQHEPLIENQFGVLGLGQSPVRMTSLILESIVDMARSEI